jgi:hypothetical protein
MHMSKTRPGIRASALAMVIAAGAVMGLSTLANAQTRTVRPLDGVAQANKIGSQAKADRNWIASYWAWVDGGKVGPGPALPRQILPSGIPVETNPLRPAQNLIRVLYRHRLQENAFLPAYYTLGNLLQDDPAAMASFRAYSLQNMLRTDMGDEQAYVHHLQLLSRPGSDLTDVRIEDGALVSIGLLTPETSDEPAVDIMSKTPPLPPGSAPPTELPKPPTREEIDERLRQPGKPPSQIDLRPFREDKPGKPGYDCDDDAEALAAWLLKKFPGGQQINIMFCGTGNAEGKGKSCHLVSVLVYGDKYYIVDGSSGTVSGPFDMPMTDEGLKQNLKALWERWYKYAMYPDINVDPGRFKPNDRSPFGPNEPLPWWHDPEVRRAFCEAIKIPAGDCDERIRRDYIHPSPEGPLPGQQPEVPQKPELEPVGPTTVPM